MTSKTGEFLLPNARDAQSRWNVITGLDAKSHDWGEVWQVLTDSRLLDADRPAEPELELGLPDAAEQHPTQRMRRLRVALIAGALLGVAERSRLDLATATAITVAAMNRLHPGVIGNEEHVIRELAGELPDRIADVFDTQSDALRWRIDLTLARWHPEERRRLRDSEIHTVLAVASTSEQVAGEVFARLSADRSVRLSLLPLCYGGWVALRLE